jgi:DUF917 family protein
LVNSTLKGVPVRQLIQSDLQPLALGAAVLGAGGGGRPNLGMLLAREAIDRHGPVTLLDACEVEDDALAVSLAMIGAPTVVIEKIPSGEEAVTALRALEEILGRQVTHVYPIEAGGVNSIVPIHAAASLQMPLVDVDGMGRAYPELQMVTANLFGITATPAVIVDAGGDTVAITNATTNVRAERLARAITIEMGCTAIMATYPMSGADLKRTLIHGTVTRAQRIGEAIYGARAAGSDPVEVLIDIVNAVHLFDGKIVDVDRRTHGGFNKGLVSLSSTKEHETLRIEFQNENLVAFRGSTVVASVPDLIVILDPDTAAPIMTEDLRYGLRASVIALPCDEKWQGDDGVALGGPRAFGYDFDFEPMKAGTRATA